MHFRIDDSKLLIRTAPRCRHGRLFRVFQETPGSNVFVSCLRGRTRPTLPKSMRACRSNAAPRAGSSRADRSAPGEPASGPASGVLCLKPRSRRFGATGGRAKPGWGPDRFVFHEPRVGPTRAAAGGRSRRPVCLGASVAGRRRLSAVFLIGRDDALTAGPLTQGPCDRVRRPGPLPHPREERGRPPATTRRRPGQVNGRLGL